MRTHRAVPALAFLVALATAGSVSRVVRNDFVVYDDETYVTRNAHVRMGLTAESLAWAATTGTAANWHPLTWVSHMIDWELFGARPWGHHLTSVVLHTANALLLFLFLERATGRAGRSALAALLFGVHPLHVESVAWVAERKDVLSTLFWLLTSLAYLRYAKAPKPLRFVPVALGLLLGLAAKPMLVTLPLTLLLLDFWPLGRLRRGSDCIRLTREKAPLFLLSVASCVLTYAVQRSGSAVRGLTEFPLGPRIGNAVVTYVVYLRRTVVPRGLAVFYPYPEGGPSSTAVVLAALFLVVVTLAALHWRKERPWLLVGWLFYLVTLVPVIGLVQVGLQASADRYTYVPLIGIFIVFAWGLGDAVRALCRRAGDDSSKRERIVFGTIAAVIVAPLSVATWVQAGTWHDSVQLLQHALAAAPPSPVVRNNLGVALERQGRVEEASGQYADALRLDPGFYDAHENLGRLLAAGGRFDEAVPHFEACVRARPADPDLRCDLAAALLEVGRIDDASREYAEGLRLDPRSVEAAVGLAGVLLRQGRGQDAVLLLERAKTTMPDDPRAHYTLAVAAAAVLDYDLAWREIHAARRLGFVPPERFLEMLAARAPEPPAEPR